MEFIIRYCYNNVRKIYRGNIMAEKIKLTKAGYKKLEEELRYKIDIERDEVKRQLAEARAQGDLSENADYDAARNKQAEVEGRIKEIEEILNNCEIIGESNKGNKVGLGSIVTIKYLETGKEAEYMIVGSVESDPFEGKISNSCALGEAIMGKQVGDVIEVKAVKTYKIEILKLTQNKI